MSLVRTRDATTWFRWDPDRVAAAVVACPGVARLVAAPTPTPPHTLVRPGGPLLDVPGAAAAAGRGGAVEAEDFGVNDAGRDRYGVAEVATYLPGRRVAGVRVRADWILVQVDCRYGEPLADLAGRIRSAVLRAAPDCPSVDVIIRDLDPPDGLASDDEPSSIDQRPSGGRSQAGGGEQPWVLPP